MLKKVCECGDTVMIGSWFPACVKCDKCGSGLNYPGEPTVEAISHDYVIEFDSTTGKPRKRCRICGEKEGDTE